MKDLTSNYDRKTKRGWVSLNNGTHIDYWRGTNKEWYWHVVSDANGKVLEPGGEGFATKFNVKRSIRGYIKRNNLSAQL